MTTEPDWLRQARAKGLEITEGNRVNLDALHTGAGSTAGAPADPAPEREDAFQQRVIDLAHKHGWLVAHFRPARCVRPDGTVYYETPVQADGAGFPDLVLVRDQVLFVELKSNTGTMRPEQEVWEARLHKAHAMHCVWRPRYWPEIEETLR